LRRYVRSAGISAERAAEALADFLDLPLTRYPHFVLLPRAWQMRHNLTAYDAAYLALAEALYAPLLTRDRVVARTGSRARPADISGQIPQRIAMRLLLVTHHSLLITEPLRNAPNRKNGEGNQTQAPRATR
jgi:hypothetical protein